MKINLELRREGDTGRSTFGALYLDGAFRCYTLEDSAANGYGKGCAIPPGRYRVTWEPSPRLKRDTLRIQDVTGRSGILIHAGNTSADCEGCILVGRKRVNENTIGESRLALAALETAVVAKIRDGAECWIKVCKP